jgi:serine protease Do
MITKSLMPTFSPSLNRVPPSFAKVFAAVLCLALLSPVSTAWAQSAPLVRGLPDFTELVDAVGPSVVNIRTLEKAKPSAGGSNAPDEQMLEFFRRFGIPVPPGVGPRSPRQAPPNQEAQPSGVGSGFVLTSDGFIMTNAHVIDGADELLVTLPDKREYKARVIGSDKRTDVAVVKVEAIGLPPVKIGDVSRLRVGEWVMAIGSPFGLDNTVTAGIVSAKQRDTGDYLPFIQTDVAINPGNSGGPLINMRGEVVGINSQIYSRSGGFQGISFAIPIDEAVRVADQLRTTDSPPVAAAAPTPPSPKTVVVKALGLGLTDLTEAQKKALGVTGGVVVTSAVGPAARAGLREDDVIVSVANEQITHLRSLESVLDKQDRSKPLSVLFRRGEWAQYTVIRPEPR